MNLESFGCVWRTGGAQVSASARRDCMMCLLSVGVSILFFVDAVCRPMDDGEFTTRKRRRRRAGGRGVVEEGE